MGVIQASSKLCDHHPYFKTGLLFKGDGFHKRKHFHYVGEKTVQGNSGSPTKTKLLLPLNYLIHISTTRNPFVIDLVLSNILLIIAKC